MNIRGMNDKLYQNILETDDAIGHSNNNLHLCLVTVALQRNVGAYAFVFASISSKCSRMRATPVVQGFYTVKNIKIVVKRCHADFDITVHQNRSPESLARIKETYF